MMTVSLTKELSLGFSWKSEGGKSKILRSISAKKNMRNKQTHFCKTCKVPEALCKDCAQQHTSKKYADIMKYVRILENFPIFNI